MQNTESARDGYRKVRPNDRQYGVVLQYLIPVGGGLLTQGRSGCSTEDVWNQPPKGPYRSGMRVGIPVTGMRYCPSNSSLIVSRRGKSISVLYCTVSSQKVTDQEQRGSVSVQNKRSDPLDLGRKQ